ELRADGELVEAPQTTEVTAEVEDLIGLDYDLFARTIYSEQNELDYFLTLRAGERKRRIDELLNLDRFETARTSLVTVINRVEGRLDDRLDDLESLREGLDEAEMDDLQDRIDDLEATIDDLEAEHESVLDDLDAVRDRVDDLAETAEELDEMERRRTA
ncbi:MAG: hypothetical protein ABEK12_00125, partial [Candidatus Nanohaloarchaea archaeon]